MKTILSLVLILMSITLIALFISDSCEINGLKGKIIKIEYQYDSLKFENILLHMKLERLKQDTLFIVYKRYGI